MKTEEKTPTAVLMTQQVPSPHTDEPERALLFTWSNVFNCTLAPDGGLKAAAFQATQSLEYQNEVR